MIISNSANNEFIISTDKSKLDIAVVYNYLCNESYWAKNITIDIVKKSIEKSFCFGLYQLNTQIGFARVITDYATFGYLADVFIIENYRGKGLSKLLMKSILSHPDLQGLRRWMLATRDAHHLYAQFGFVALDNPKRFMQLSLFNEYPAIEVGG